MNASVLTIDSSDKAWNIGFTQIKNKKSAEIAYPQEVSPSGTIIIITALNVRVDLLTEFVCKLNLINLKYRSQYFYISC
jgi:hypothetical protein